MFREPTAVFVECAVLLFIKSCLFKDLFQWKYNSFIYRIGNMIKTDTLPKVQYADNVVKYIICRVA